MWAFREGRILRLSLGKQKQGVCTWVEKIHLFLSQFLLTWINLSDSQVLYEEISIPSLHPRTFYLSPNQEFQVISQVLCEGLPCPEYTITHDYPYFIQQRNYRAFTFYEIDIAS
ncbi:uncharacterized protein CEXT_479961 [Caerostris extrusa]|uniref:Uncharacterized protein n=1 Tax=Caerostris extrusa TaxID=172846 RepID=A0AAV4RM13_CAEEX|nr:uncharacterized protein CEXT_479961 [Caerostris extrusa]